MIASPLSKHTVRLKHNVSLCLGAFSRNSREASGSLKMNDNCKRLHGRRVFFFSFRFSSIPFCIYSESLFVATVLIFLPFWHLRFQVNRTLFLHSSVNYNVHVCVCVPARLNDIALYMHMCNKKKQVYKLIDCGYRAHKQLRNTKKKKEIEER